MWTRLTLPAPPTCGLATPLLRETVRDAIENCLSSLYADSNAGVVLESRVYYDLLTPVYVYVLGKVINHFNKLIRS